MLSIFLESTSYETPCIYENLCQEEFLNWLLPKFQSCPHQHFSICSNDIQADNQETTRGLEDIYKQNNINSSSPAAQDNHVNQENNDQTITFEQVNEDAPQIVEEPKNNMLPVSSTQLEQQTSECGFFFKKWLKHFLHWGWFVFLFSQVVVSSDGGFRRTVLGLGVL